MTDAGSIVGRSEPDARGRCAPHQAVTGYYTTLPLGGANVGTPRGTPGVLTGAAAWPTSCGLCGARQRGRGGAGRAFMSFMCSEVHVECMHER